MRRPKISVVFPIHNEEDYLPYSLAGLARTPVDELIVILDRCTDRSEEIIDRFIMSNEVSASLEVKVIKKYDQKWRCPTAEVFEIGFSNASGDWIYVGAGDLVYPPGMFKKEYYDLGFDMLLYFYRNFDLRGRFRIRQHFIDLCKEYLTVPIRKKKARYRSGVFGCRRELWEKLRFRDVPSEYDDLHDRALHDGFKVGFLKPEGNIYHLRVGLSPSRQNLQGMSRAQTNRHPVPVFLHSLLFMKPHLWTAYYHERRYRIFERKKWRKEGY